MSKILYTATIPKFKTHVKQSANKWKKINGQSIYTGAHHRVRHLFMEQINSYLTMFISPINGMLTEYPLEINVKIYAPINYGDVKRLRGKISWKKPEPGYEPSWDLDNFAWIWIKGMQDVLQKQKVLPEDTVKHIRKVSYEFIPIEELEDRKMELMICTADTYWTSFWKKLFTKITPNGNQKTLDLN